jgi:hypothetical protein
MKTEREILMFYQTSLRNIGLYTSISLGLLGYSRFYRGKKKIYNLTFIILSLAILLCALIICLYLIQDLEHMKISLEKKIYLEKWIIIPQLVFGIDILIGLFGLSTLYSEITKL